MGDFVPGLYVVGTPIGNLKDLSDRARSVLGAARVVAAEDTRTSGKLTRLAGARGALVSLTEHNIDQRKVALLAAAHEGVVVLVSDAGTPVVADPGARLVAAAHEAGVPVFAVPGPSALTAAVSISGFEGSDIHFLGFLPRPRGQRLTRLRQAAESAPVLVFFESPGRLSATLLELAEHLGDPEVAVCRELTKLHEEVVRGPASKLATRFQETKGECTVVVQSPPRPESSDAELQAYMADMQAAGARRADAAALAARRFRVPRERAYRLWKAR